jgi:uracil phosphoribosyltransferase
MEIVQHPTDWKAALRHQSIGYREFENVMTTPFRMLIRKMPSKSKLCEQEIEKWREEKNLRIKPGFEPRTF